MEQIDWVQRCRKHIERETTFTHHHFRLNSFIDEDKKNAIIQAYYDEGRLHQQINMSFETFYLRSTKSWCYRFRLCAGPNFREQKKYRRQPHHAKKENKEDIKAKEAWKARKKRKKSINYGPKGWAKKFSQRRHRAWQRHNIANENWETLQDFKMIKLICDPWIWD